MNSSIDNILELLGGGDSLRALLMLGILFTAVLIFGFFAWSVIRTQLQNRNKESLFGVASDLPKSRQLWLDIRRNMDKALNAIRYLTTYREWRYRTSWYLLCGDKSSGKTSLINSVTSGRRQHLLLKEKKLVTEGTGWQFFNKGVVIDVEGRYFMAPQESTDDDGWDSIIEIIQRYRPERPLDGIILTVPADKLMMTENPAELHQLGDHIYKKLWEIQKQYAFVLPVYFVITKCDLIEGFHAFWKPFDTGRYEEIFGWSNNNTLDNIFSATWINNAFKYIEDRLHKAQLDIAASSPVIDSPDEFFLFPSHFKQLQKPITALLEKVFEQSAFHESFFFRGLYFTGMLPAVDDTDKNKVRNAVRFSDHLFAAKIFAETNLARAVQQSLISRNRLIRRIQIGSIAALIALWTGFFLDKSSLNNQINTVMTVLKSVQGARLQCMHDTQEVNRLLMQIAEMDAGTLSRPGIPVSWFSPVDEDLSQHLADDVFAKVVFPNMECLFYHKLYDLIYTKVEDTDIQKDPVTMSNQIRQELEERLYAILEYEQKFKLFQELSVEQQKDNNVLEKFSSLAAYLFKHSLPSEFHHKKDLYEKALLKVSYKHGAGFNNKNSPLTKAHIEKYRLLLTVRIEKISIQLQSAIVQTAIMPEQLASRIAALQNSDIEKGLHNKPTSFADDIRYFAVWLKNLENNWLRLADTQNPCDVTRHILQDFNKTIIEYNYPQTRLNRSANLFGKDACYFPFAAKLVSNRLPGVGPLFYEKSNHTLAVKDYANHLLKQADALEKISYFYIEPDSLGKPAEFPPLYWDINKLNTALSYYDEYEKLIGNLHAENGNEQQSVYKLIAQSKLQQMMNAVLSEAQLDSVPIDGNTPFLRPLSAKEERIALQIRNFRKAVGLLQQLSAVFSQLGWRDSYTRLSTASRSYVIKMLEELSSLVEESRLYEMNPQPRWEASNFVEALYELNNDIQIKDYLKNQKNRIEYISYNYAEPLIGFIINTYNTDSRNDLSIIDYWRNTLNEMNREQRKDPAGKLAQLEQYFLTKLNAVNQENCADYLKDLANLNRGYDTFSMAHRKIGHSLIEYCHGFNQDKAASQYEMLADAFNSTLAGRYPFSYPLDSGRYEADISIVKTFFYQNKNAYTGLADRLSLWDKTEKNHNSIRFARELESCANFFNTLFSNESDGTIMQQPVSITVDFRAYAEQAAGSNQIVSWTLSNGKDALIYPDGEGKFNWLPGNPLSLTLKWASGSSFEPVKLAGAWQPEVESVNATFASGGDWALIHFLQTYKTSGLSKTEIFDQDQHVLEFNTPVTTRNANTNDNEGLSVKQISKTYLKMMLNVLDPKTKQTITLKMPKPFPAFAPDLKR